MKLSKYLYISKPIQRGTDNGKVFVFSTRSSLSMLMTPTILRNLQANDFSCISPSLEKKLNKYKILVPNEENEFATVFKENSDAKAISDVLSLTIQPTANCQFGCHYCGQQHRNHQMGKDVESFCLSRIRHVLTTVPRYKKVGITWYGGEPLLGLSVMQSLSYKIQELCREKEKQYRADMVTNGYLLKKETFLNLLIEHKVKEYQITLDGVSKSHDQRRVLKKSRGATFGVIYENIKEIVRLPEYSKYNAHINIRINIDKTNYKEVDNLLVKLIRDNIADKVAISFAPIEDWGGNNAGKNSFSHEEFSALHMNWIQFCIDNHIRVATLIPNRNYASCMVESDDNEVFDAYGNVYPCWEFPYSSYKGEDYKIASIDKPEGTKHQGIALTNIAEKIKNGEYECARCVFYPLCGGGCPLALHEGRNSCPTYKYDLDQRLLMDYKIRKKK